MRSFVLTVSSNQYSHEHMQPTKEEIYSHWAEYLERDRQIVNGQTVWERIFR